MDTNEIILYQPDETLTINVRVENETVWLNRNQIAQLFGRDVKTIGKHINNALQEELDGVSVVAKFAITAADGKTYQVEHYNLEMITSIGYRVKSKQGIQFRQWANKIAAHNVVLFEHTNEILKCVMYLFKGYLNVATHFAQSSGGGSSDTSLSWGRKDDEDDRRFAYRCMMQACRMMKPAQPESGILITILLGFIYILDLLIWK